MKKNKKIMFLIVSILLFSCDNVKNKNLIKQINTLINPSTVIPLESYVHLRAVFNAKTIFGINEMRPISANGVIVKNTKKGSYILTINHYCSFTLKLPIIKIENVYRELYDYNKKTYKVTYVDNDIKNDLCLLFSPKLFQKKANISFKKQTIGERVFAFKDMSGEKIIQIFEGFYIGKEKKNFIKFENEIQEPNLYSLYASPGSSGTPIFNINGKIIGIISNIIITDNFQRSSYITVGPSLKDIRRFLEKNAILEKTKSKY